jgi:hypothetical protein
MIIPELPWSQLIVELELTKGRRLESRWEIGSAKGWLAKGDSLDHFAGDGAMVNQQPAAVSIKLSAEQEELAQRIYGRLRAKLDDELWAMARLMASKADHEIFGPGEFELRDKLNAVGATIVAESAN